MDLHKHCLDAKPARPAVRGLEVLGSLGTVLAGMDRHCRVRRASVVSAIAALAALLGVGVQPNLWVVAALCGAASAFGAFLSRQDALTDKHLSTLVTARWEELPVRALDNVRLRRAGLETIMASIDQEDYEVFTALKDESQGTSLGELVRISRQL